MGFVLILAGIVIVGSFFISHKKPQEPKDINEVENLPCQDDFYF